ncbi:MAG: glycosyltransferase [Bacillaceae bacterium]|nr:glycosyltransferase [Bacillaceae bacterium]
MKQEWISIVFPAKNEGDHVKSTLDSLFQTKTKQVLDVIVVDDGSEDGCCDFIQSYEYKNRVKLVRTNGIGASRARNLGARLAKGELLVFCDAHLNFEDWWIDRLLEPVISGKTDAIASGIASQTNPSSVGYGQTLDHNLEVKWNPRPPSITETPILPGGCFMIPKSIFDDVGGFDRGFKVWGYEDIEISIKLWLFGYRCSVHPDVSVLHLFRKIHPYSVSFDHVYYNLMRMAYSHFNEQRIEKCKQKIVHRKADSIEAEVIRDGAIKQRENYFKKRRHDDSWFFEKFNIRF